MIRVIAQEEPRSFKATVQEPGLRKLARLLGQDVPGKSNRPKKTYTRLEDIPTRKFPPEWRHCLDDLMTAYRQICAYTCLYIEDGTGERTVDHWQPITTHPHLAYVWSNYRLACGQVNKSKGTQVALDPFMIEDDWFELELVGYQVLPGARTTDPLRSLIRHNVDVVLDLNSPRLRRQRGQDAEAYLHGEVSFSRLGRHSPFVARELRRQGKLRPEDQVPR